MPGGGEPPVRPRVHLSGAAAGARSQGGPGGGAQGQPQGEGAPLPGGAQAPQPLLHRPQHGAAEADRGGRLPLLPAARRQAEAAPAADAAEAGAPRRGRRPAGLWPGGAAATAAAGHCGGVGLLPRRQTQAQEHAGVRQDGALTGVRARGEGDGPRRAHGHAGPRALPAPPQAQGSAQERLSPETTSTGPVGEGEHRRGRAPG